MKGVSNVTIAGQTAPGPGITLTNYKFQITSSTGAKFQDITSNVIVRYLGSRRGSATSTAQDDAIGVLGSTSNPVANTHDIILDHVSAAWGTDEDLSVSDSVQNVTISNSYIEESLQGGHQFGSLIRPRLSANVSYLHNLYANNASRNPRPGTYNGNTLNFDFRNNVVYNWGDRAGYTGGATEGDPENVNMNYVGNYVIAGPSTPAGFKSNTAFTVDTGSGVKDPLNIQVYQANNFVDSNHNATRDGTDTGWNAFIRYDGVNATPFGGTNTATVTTVQEAQPFAYAVSGISTTDPTTAYQQSLASGGTTPWARNESDARIVNQVQTNTGAVLIPAAGATLASPPATEWNDLINQSAVSRPAGFDTDQDGMADAWEKARGLNPAIADNNLVVTSTESPTLAGYTWLEMYLNDLTLQASWAGGANGDWDTLLNWNGQAPNLQDSTAAFGNLGTAGHVTVNSHEHVGQLSLDNPSGYSFTGTGDITMDVLNHTGGTGAYATVTVNSGTHTLAVPLSLASDTHFTIAGGSLLDVTGPLNAAGRLLSKDGDGDVQFGNVRAAGLNITAGTVRLRQGALPNDAAGVSVLGALGVTPGAHFDLTNNTLILPYTAGNGPTTLTGVRNLLAGNQLTSTSADAGHRLGYADNASLGIHNIGGLDPGSNSVLIEFAFAGDTDLSGSTDDSDFQTFAAHFGTPTGAVWPVGDFDYNGTVDANDFRLLLAGMAASGQVPGQDVIDFGTGIGILVPEPGTMSLLLVGSVGYLQRRRRRPMAHKSLN